MSTRFRALFASHWKAAGRRLGERGVAIVEFALVLPLLLALVFGIVDFGRAFQSWITITNAAREGARLGAVGGTSDQICARVTATAGVTPVTCTATNASPTGITGQSVTVNVGYTLQFITPLGSVMSLFGGGGLKNTYDLSATADMRIE